MSDFSETLTLQKRLAQAAKRIKELAPLVGSAKTIRAYDSDRRKQLLSSMVVKAYKAGAESNVEAEHKARSEAGYVQKMDLLKQEMESAEQTIAMWDAEQCAWDTCRSLLAISRETLRQIPE